jgi:ferredoxin
MSLPISQMVKAGNLESSDCILCGNCVDACQQQVIAYRFGRPAVPQPREAIGAAPADSARGPGK